MIILLFYSFSPAQNEKIMSVSDKKLKLIVSFPLMDFLPWIMVDSPNWNIVSIQYSFGGPSL